MSTTLTQHHINRLSRLAQIPLTVDQKRTLNSQITDILTNVADIQSLDLSQTPPTNQVTNKVNEFRADIVSPSLSPDQALSMASQTHNGYFVVPAVIDHEAK